MVITEYLIFASVFFKEKWSEGYHWVHIQLEGTHEIITNEIRIHQSAKHIKTKDIDSVMKILKVFEKR